jgi:hypothetical protein
MPPRGNPEENTISLNLSFIPSPGARSALCAGPGAHRSRDPRGTKRGGRPQPRPPLDGRWFSRSTSEAAPSPPRARRSPRGHMRRAALTIRRAGQQALPSGADSAVVRPGGSTHRLVDMATSGLVPPPLLRSHSPCPLCKSTSRFDHMASCRQVDMSSSPTVDMSLPLQTSMPGSGSAPPIE